MTSFQTTRLVLVVLASIVGSVSLVCMANEYANTPAKIGESRLAYTARELDVAIEGPGYFQLSDPSGLVVYTRRGDFSINENGLLIVGPVSKERLLEPAISIPYHATRVIIHADGAVMVQETGLRELILVGQIQLATFAKPQHLKQLDDHTFAQTDESGSPQLGDPAVKGFGVLRQHFLGEMSAPTSK